jgi:hypothetical protein
LVSDRLESDVQAPSQSFVGTDSPASRQIFRLLADPLAGLDSPIRRFDNHAFRNQTELSADFP